LYQYKSKEAQMPQTQIALPLRRRTNLAARLVTAITTAVRRQRDRRQLAKLDAHLLRDIGLGAQDAESECAKPFWKD
jgi:uncharacterized protein YjiS (DUF1127 family)